MTAQMKREKKAKKRSASDKQISELAKIMPDIKNDEFLLAEGAWHVPVAFLSFCSLFAYMSSVSQVLQLPSMLIRLLQLWDSIRGVWRTDTTVLVDIICVAPAVLAQHWCHIGVSGVVMEFYLHFPTCSPVTNGADLCTSYPNQFRFTYISHKLVVMVCKSRLFFQRISCFGLQAILSCRELGKV